MINRIRLTIVRCFSRSSAVARRLVKKCTVTKVTDQKEIDQLIAFINESAKQISPLILTFLASVIYIAIAAAATTDEQLLLDKPLTLPLFNVGVSIKAFYWIAPLIVILLHLNLLLHEYFIAYRIYRLPSDIRTSEKQADRFFIIPSLSMRLKHQQHPFVVVVLRVIFMAVTVFLPIVVLVLMRVRFLPYHGAKLTFWHAVFIYVDLILVWVFFGFRPRPEDGAVAGKQKNMRRAEIAFYLGVTIVLAFLVDRVAVIPRLCSPSWEDKIIAPIGHRNLVLRNRVLALQEASPEIIAANGALMPDVIWTRFSRGVVLSSRDLRCADFSGSRFINADFRGARLDGAKFIGASLQGANFSPLNAVDLRLPKSSPSDTPEIEHLYSAETLQPTSLTGVDFRGANLRETNFRFSVLTDALLEKADLRSADLSFANLEGAGLVGARLFGADLNSSTLRRANLQGAQLQGANLKLVAAEFASFVGAILDGAELSYAKMEGSDFTNASLRGTTGTSLEGMDLRQADLTFASFCREQKAMMHVELRDVELNPSDQTGIDSNEMKKGLSEEPNTIVKERLENIGKVDTCLTVGPPENKRKHNVLYSERQVEDLGRVGLRRERWPEPVKSEDSFYEDLASFLVESACWPYEGPQLVLALSRRVNDRLTVDRNDPAAKALSRRLVRAFLDQTCPPSFALPQDVKHGILRWVYLP